MKEVFVTYKMAVAMRALGFNDPCFGYYVFNSNEIKYHSEPKWKSKRLDYIQAPTYQQVCDWLYKVSGGRLIVYYTPSDSEEIRIEKFDGILETAKQWKESDLFKFNDDVKEAKG